MFVHDVKNKMAEMILLPVPILLKLPKIHKYIVTSYDQHVVRHIVYIYYTIKIGSLNELRCVFPHILWVNYKICDDNTHYYWTEETVQIFINISIIDQSFQMSALGKIMWKNPKFLYFPQDFLFFFAQNGRIICSFCNNIGKI